MMRLTLAGAALVALTLFAMQSWGPSTTTQVQASSDRAALEEPTDAAPLDRTAARQTNDDSDQDDEEATDDSDDSDDSDDGSVTMTLLHNNDGESKLLPNPDEGFPGIARFAQQWVELGGGTDADILLRVTSGDNFLASKEFSAGLGNPDHPLFDSIALRGLYEAMGLGNHDFDFGPDVTARFIEGFRLNESSMPVPFLAANIDVSAEPALQALADEGRVAPSTIVTDPTSGMTVGVIGAITPRLPNISSPRNVVVDPDVAGRVNDEAAALIDQGVDRIVLVSHLQGLAEDQALVPELRGVDIVVAGGGDELLKNDGDTCQPDEEAFDSYPLLLTDADGNSVPVVTAPGGYRCIGRLDVVFDAGGNITELSGSSIGVPLDGETEAFAKTRVEEPLTEALAELEAAVIGESEVDLDGRRDSVRTASSNEGELLADALLFAGQAAPDFGGMAPLVAVQNGGGIRNDSVIAAGEITEADTFDIAPFANFVVTGEISRDQFKEMLEVGVAGLPAAEGTFPQIAGFSLEVDASAPGREIDDEGDCSLIGDAGSRVTRVTLDDGTEIVVDGDVVPGDDIALATIDFLAGGGDCYPLADAEFVQVGASYQQALSTFITEGLAGKITADDYPEGGSRIAITGIADVPNTGSGDTDSGDTDSGDTGSADTDSGDTDSADDADTSTGDDAGADETTDGAAGTDDGELPNTGLDSGLVLIIALTIAIGGALIFFEAQRAGRLSLGNRLSATQAWIPAEPEDENQATDA